MYLGSISLVLIRKFAILILMYMCVNNIIIILLEDGDVMKFVELSEKEFEKACDDIRGNCFYQSVAWAKIKELNGWKYYFVGVKKNNKIIAVSLILGKKVFLNKYLYYAPRGVLMDYNNNKLLSFFTENIKYFLLQRGGIFLKIDPFIEYQKHDNAGNVVGELKNDDILNNLCKLGYKHHGFTTGYSAEIQFRWSYCLDITISMDDIIKNMDQRCRRCIRKAENYPLELKILNNDDLSDFKDIMESTAIRQNHFDRSLDYYKNLNTYLGDRSLLAIIYLDRDKYLEKFTGDKLYDVIKQDTREKIPISAGVFIYDNDRLNYVYGGTYREYMSLMAQYKMQMEMIKLAKEKKLPLYDFGGISGNFTPGSENYGVYEFKRGFHGNVIEYIGEFDLPLKKFDYYMYVVAYKLYRNIKKITATIKK